MVFLPKCDVLRRVVTQGSEPQLAVLYGGQGHHAAVLHPTRWRKSVPPTAKSPLFWRDQPGSEGPRLLRIPATL